MSPKSVALVAATAMVLVAGVYLFIQVRATPAQAGASAPRTPQREAVAERASEPAAVHPSSSTNPAMAKQARVAAATDAPRTADSPEPAVAPDDEQRVNLKKDNLMELANKAYDRQDFDEATAIAGKVLAKDPTNVRMLRIMVSASCIQGDNAIAQQHYEKLPKFDREQMQARCDRYGVTFKEPAQ